MRAGKQREKERNGVKAARLQSTLRTRQVLAKVQRSAGALGYARCKIDIIDQFCPQEAGRTHQSPGMPRPTPRRRRRHLALVKRHRPTRPATVLQQIIRANCSTLPKPNRLGRRRQLVPGPALSIKLERGKRVPRLLRRKQTRLHRLRLDPKLVREGPRRGAVRVAVLVTPVFEGEEDAGSVGEDVGARRSGGTGVDGGSEEEGWDGEGAGAGCEGRGGGGVAAWERLEVAEDDLVHVGGLCGFVSEARRMGRGTYLAAAPFGRAVVKVEDLAFFDNTGGGGLQRSRSVFFAR